MEQEGGRPVLFPVAFVVGAVTGWVMQETVLAAIGGAVIAVVLAFIGQAVIGILYLRQGRADVPLDLAFPIPYPLTKDGYMGLPLAARNAVVARLAAQSCGWEVVERVLPLLPDLMGRTRVSSLSSQRGAAALWESIRPELVDRDSVSPVCAAELALAGRAALPPNDRVRAAVERNLGTAVDETTMVHGIATSRTRLGKSILELVRDAMEGRADIAFVVGTIRKVGEYHAREIAKIH